MAQNGVKTDAVVSVEAAAAVAAAARARTSPLEKAEGIITVARMQSVLWCLLVFLMFAMIVSCHRRIEDLEARVLLLERAGRINAVDDGSERDENVNVGNVKISGEQSALAEETFHSFRIDQENLKLDDADDDNGHDDDDDILRTDSTHVISRQRRSATDEPDVGTRRRHNNKRRLRGRANKRNVRTAAFHLKMNNEEYQRQSPVSENELGFPYRSWTPAQWTQNMHSDIYDYNHETGKLTVKHRGIYFIYAQILYHNSAARSSYAVMIDSQAFIQCWTSVDAVEANKTSEYNARHKTCYVGAATKLDKDQEVWINDCYGNPIGDDEQSSYFGIVKVADSA